VRKKIIIVDDSSSNLLLLSNFLESEGFEVATCFSGRDAILTIQNDKPDLILLDLMMPGVDGLMVLKAVRSQSTTATIPVIVISAVGEPEKINEVKAIGVYDYMVKPINFELILERVKEVLGL